MTNTKITADATTLEAISIVATTQRELEESPSSDELVRNRDGGNEHEDNRPPSLKEKRRNTPLSEVDEARAKALQNTKQHALGQLIKQPTQNVEHAEIQYTADRESFVVSFDDYLSEDEKEYIPESRSKWTFEIPSSLAGYIDIDRQTAANYGRDLTREGDESGMALPEALSHLEAVDVNVNNYFPDEFYYNGNIEPEFAFDLSGGEGR